MAYDYVKLGVIQKNNKKEVVFSDMGFIHQDDTRDAYDGNGTSSDNFIFTAKNGNHIFTLTAYENGSNIGSIQFTVPSGILTQATTIDDVCYIMAQNTSYDSFGVFLVMYIVYSIETYTENNTKYLKLYCENMFTGRDTTIDVNVSDYTWDIKDALVGAKAYKGQLGVVNKFDSYDFSIQQTIRHIPLNKPGEPTPSTTKQVTAGMALANSNHIIDCSKDDWTALYGTNRMLELLVRTNADGGCVWISPTAYTLTPAPDYSGTGDLLELSSTRSGNTATLTVTSWYNGSSTIITQKQFSIGRTPKYADWCFVKKNGRLAIQYTVRADGYESYNFFEHIITGTTAENLDTILSKMQKTDGQYILKGSLPNVIYLRANGRNDHNTTDAGFFNYYLDVGGPQSSTAWHTVDTTVRSDTTDNESASYKAVLHLPKGNIDTRIYVKAISPNLYNGEAITQWTNYPQLKIVAESGNVYVDNTPKELISAYGKSGEAEARVYIYGYVGSDGYLYLKSFAKYRYWTDTGNWRDANGQFTVSKIEQYYNDAQ